MSLEFLSPRPLFPDSLLGVYGMAAMIREGCLEYLIRKVLTCLSCEVLLFICRLSLTLLLPMLLLLPLPPAFTVMHVLTSPISKDLKILLLAMPLLDKEPPFLRLAPGSPPLGMGY